MVLVLLEKGLIKCNLYVHMKYAFLKSSSYSIKKDSKVILQQRTKVLKNLFNNFTEYDTVYLKSDNGNGQDQMLKRMSSNDIYTERENRINSKHWIKRIFFRSFLPIDYPHSVHSFYAPFCSWSFLQGIIGHIISVLSTQALLLAMGMSANHAITSAVALQWVLKDVLGHFGGIITAGLLGSRFDVEVKRLRFFSIIIMYVASLLEVTTLTMPNYFLLFASLANLTKNVAWIIISATRASLLMQFTKRGQFGDLTAKSSSQNTATSLIGSTFGIALSNYFSLSTFESFMTAYFPLSIVGLYALYKSITYIICNTLTKHRLDILLEHFFLSRSKAIISLLEGQSESVENVEQIFNNYTFMKPSEVSIQESFIPFSSYFKSSITDNIRINFPLKSNEIKELVSNSMSPTDDNHFNYIMAVKPPFLYLWTMEKATAKDKAFAYFLAFISLKLYGLTGNTIHPTEFNKMKMVFDMWLSCLAQNDWNVFNVYIPEMESRQIKWVNL